MADSDKIQDLERTVAALERRLATVEDAQAIQNLKARYGQLADSRYNRHGALEQSAVDRIAREIASLFSADAVWDGGAGLGLCEGRSAIYERLARPTLRFSWHYFVKPNIVVEGDRAHGTWDILAPCTTQEGRAMWMSGLEEDRYQKVDDRWLHSAMKLRVVFMAPHERGWA